jgi:energy-converting hydrogenase Eha subunit A
MVSIEKLREPKFMNMAIFDLVGTFIISWIIHTVLWMYPIEMQNKEKRTYAQYIASVIFIFVMFLGIGVIFHRIFGIQSALSAYLGFNDMPIR